MLPFRGASLLPLLTAALASACADGAPGPAGGSPLEESIRPVWTLAPEPALLLGSVDGPEETAFGGVASAFTRSDGSLVVIDRETHQIRFFTPAGEHFRTVGGSGSGPGEYESIRHAFPLPGDSLAVFDLPAQRMTILDSAGTYVRSFQHQWGIDWVLGRLDDGRWLVRGDFRTDRERATTDDPRPALLAYHEDGAIDTLMRLPPSTGARVAMIDGTETFLFWPFEPGLWNGVLGGHLALGETDRHRIHILEPDGDTIRTLVGPLEPRPLSDAERQRYLDPVDDRSAARSRGDPSVELRAAYEAQDWSDQRRLWSGARQDDAGRYWVERATAFPDDPRVHDVFDADGTWLGTVEVPEDVAILHIGRDHLVGRMRLDYGVPAVGVWRFMEPEEAR